MVSNISRSGYPPLRAGILGRQTSRFVSFHRAVPSQFSVLHTIEGGRQSSFYVIDWGREIGSVELSAPRGRCGGVKLMLPSGIDSRPRFLDVEGLLKTTRCGARSATHQSPSCDQQSVSGWRNHKGRRICGYPGCVQICVGIASKYEVLEMVGYAKRKSEITSVAVILARYTWFFDRRWYAENYGRKICRTAHGAAVTLISCSVPSNISCSSAIETLTLKLSTRFTSRGTLRTTSAP